MESGLSPKNIILYIVFYSIPKSILYVVTIFFHLDNNLSITFVDESLLKQL